MRMNDMILISVDDHVVEPPDMFKNHLPAQYQARAPRSQKNKRGDDVWVWEGREMPNIGLNAVAGRVPEEYGMEPTSYDQMRKGCYDVHARIGDMNVNGQLASMCFSSYPGLCGRLWIDAKDKELSQIICGAYNDWHIDEWCAAYPGRFIPLAMLPLWDPKLSAEEIRRVARKGCHAVSISENPAVCGLPSIHDDAYWAPIWQACCDEGVVVCMHIGTGTRMAITSMDMPVDASITATPMSIASAAADLLFSQAIRSYPDLTFVLSEGGIGWIPYFLERSDYVYEHHHAWTHQDFGKKKPSEVFREHVITCFFDDPIGVRMRHEIGIDNITWECDYPHSDATWPRSPETLWRTLEGVPDEDIHKMTWQNAARVFRFDPFVKLRREECTVAALRAKATQVDLTPLRGVGGTPPGEGMGKVVRMRTIVQQLSSALDSQA